MGTFKNVRFKIKENRTLDWMAQAISDVGIINSIVNDDSRFANLNFLEREFLGELIKNKNFSSKYKSQIGQDIFTNILLNGKKSGYFIEIGVGDGTTLSNSYFFEKELNWNGILCEPNTHFHENILKERTCILCKDAIYNKSMQDVNLLSVDNFKEFSSLELSNTKDHIHREDSNILKVNTITFEQLAKLYNIPTKIDYISIDTEGSEFEILESIDLKKFDVSVFTIEHNYEVSRQNKLKELMFLNGYMLFNPNLTHFDYWFYKV